MAEINFTQIEKKWQKKWEESKCFEVRENPKKKKFYVLEMYPYPSASFLHMGHVRNYTIGDVFARFKRMSGFNVLYPMGYDSFGLPAETAAKKSGIHPQKYTEDSIKEIMKYQKALGNSYDWSKILASHEPDYYRWNQFFFLKMFEKGLAYRKKAPVNWCEKCQSVLANEESEGGKCWRCGEEVKTKELEQWFFKITNYADRLLNDLDKIQWPEKIKTMQRNWIGRSEGTEIEFEISKNLNFVLLHGYGGSPDANFFPWLKKELESRGHKVTVPKLPNTDNPNINEQVNYVIKNCKFDENTILLGHSLGGVIALKVVEQLKKPIKKLILAAGFIEPNTKDRPYVKTFEWKFNLENIKNNSGQIILLKDKNDKAIREGAAIKLKNAIGGTIIDFEAQKQHIRGDEEPIVLENCLEKWPIFTTRPDTIFGVTFMVVSSQHPRLIELVTKEQKKEVEKFLKKVKSVSEEDLEKLNRQKAEPLSNSSESSQIKEGVFTGSYAINPMTKEKIPVWAGNFVIADYGSGMVMAVPSHDQRDFEFADKYEIPMKEVIRKKTARYFVIEKSLLKEKVKELENFGNVKIEEDFGDWGNGIAVYVDIENEERLIEFLKKNILKKSKEAIGWYANSGEFAIFNNKVIPISSSKDVKAFKEYGRSLGIPEKQLDLRVDCFTEYGVLINSGNFNGLFSEEAKIHITKYLEEKKQGRKVVNYKLRDWMISRQRYWGTPIPIIYCEECGVVPVPEKDLPVLLPEKVDFKVSGNPLETSKEFVNTKCPKCGGKSRRETDTMGGFVDSSWYFLRYCDNKNNKKAFDEKKVNYWMPVDQYIGGAEHAVMHLMYARFFVKVLKDLGFVKFEEPFMNLFNQGIVYKDGAKMSKSKGNVVFQTDISDKYGIDTARLFLMLVSSPDKQMEWSDDGVEGSYRILNKLVRLSEKIVKNATEREEHKVNSVIKKVSESICCFEYPKSIISIVELIDGFQEGISKKGYETILKLISPFCPHITEELWEKIGNKSFISLAEWPVADEKKINPQIEQQEKAVEKTISDIQNILKILESRGEKTRKKITLFAIPNEINLYKSAEEKIRKVFGLEVEILSIQDAGKTGKKIKAVPGKPGILIE